MNPNSHIAAFFDFDETLLDVESGRLGIQWLWDRRMVPLGYILKIQVANFFYQRQLLSDERMVRILLTFYKKRRFLDFQKGAVDFYRQYLKPHLAPNILCRVEHHRQQGHVLVLISGSIRYLLEPVAADLGFDHLLCTDLEVGSDGFLTGRAQGPLCLDSTKRALAEKLAEEIDINLATSYAYGNHQSDLPLLELVGHPFAVEPTEPLKQAAIENTWPILTYR